MLRTSRSFERGRMRRYYSTADMPAPYDEYTKLLLHFNGTNSSTGFIDEVGHIITPAGNAKISTAESKFGGASGAFLQESTNDYLAIGTSSWNFGGNDFTVEGWVYFNTNDVGYQCLASKRDGSINGWVLYIETGNALSFVANLGGETWDVQMNTGIIPDINTWCHLAIVRNGSNFTYYVNGSAAASATASGSITSNTNPLYLAWGGADLDYYFRGYMDEFRISNTARWTDDFTPPTQEY